MASLCSILHAWRPLAAPLLLATLVLVLSAPAHAQVPTRHTQQIPLAPGPNLVSLSVLPDDNRLDVLLSGATEHIVAVQSASGRHYVPRLGVRRITHWQPGQAYVIFARQAHTLHIEGTPLTEPLPLAAGWNWIPYLASEALPVEAALTSVLPQLNRVEDGAGRVFPAQEGRPVLTHLEPGQGYRVHLRAPASLAYPAGEAGQQPPPPPPPPQATHVVASIADALALTGLEPGQIVHVLGYATPGDGGGGYFDVTASGAPLDGGTVFVPLEHQSDVVTEDWIMRTNRRALTTLPPGARIVFGTVHVTLRHPATGEALLEVDGRLLNGHELAQANLTRPILGYATGSLDDWKHRFYGYFNRVIGSGWGGRVVLTYRHTTSDLRLERRDVGEVLNARWFGARTHDEDPAFDNQPVLAQMINVAAARNAVAPGSVTTIYLPNMDGRSTVYEYFGAIEMGDGLTLAGDAGTEVVTATAVVSGEAHQLPDGTTAVHDALHYTVSGEDITFTYRPVRVRADATVLRVKSGEALRFLQMFHPASDPRHLPTDAKHMLHQRASVITSAHGIMSMGLRDLVLDGNYAGNAEGFEQNLHTFAQREEWMRNAPGWAGFVATNHGGKRIPQGQQVTVRNAAILGFGSNGVLGNANNTWTGENVLLGDALWNHVMYHTNGTWTNLTFTGFAWTHAVWQRGRVNNLVYERGSVAPSYTSRRGPDLFNIRGGDGSDESNITSVGSFRREDGTIGEVSTRINGFFADFRDSELHQIFNGIGSDIRVRDGVVILTPNRGINSIMPRNGNNPRAIYAHNLFQNATFFATGRGGQSLAGQGLFTQSAFRNLRVVEMTRQHNRTWQGTAAELTVARNDHPSFDLPSHLVLEGLDLSRTRHYYVIRVDVRTEAQHLDAFVLNSTFRNEYNTVYIAPDGNGRITGLHTPRPDLLRVYWRNNTFRLHRNHIGNTELFFAMTFFEQCTETNSGRTSEDAGIFTTTAAHVGQSFVVLPTNLFWAPYDLSSVSVTDSHQLTQSVEVTNAAGNPLGDDKRQPFLRVNLSRPIQAGETVTFTYTAAVRPWPAGVTVPEVPGRGSW
ncbi:MAG: hypothetical protein ACK41D_12215 [Rubricoccaceae bacterium]